MLIRFKFAHGGVGDADPWPFARPSDSTAQSPQRRRCWSLMVTVVIKSFNPCGSLMTMFPENFNMPWSFPTSRPTDWNDFGLSEIRAPQNPMVYHHSESYSSYWVSNSSYMGSSLCHNMWMDEFIPLKQPVLAGLANRFWPLLKRKTLNDSRWSERAFEVAGCIRERTM